MSTSTLSILSVAAAHFGISVRTLIFLISILGIWEIVWKGIALWKSGRRGSKVWFIVLLIVNTAGILEILYIFVFSRKPRIAAAADGGTTEAQ